MTGSPLWSWKRKLGGPELSFVDSSIYTDPEIFELELEKIWRRTWLLAVHESELPNRYDYRTLTIAREPVLVIRGEDDKIRAFLNVCPHRGTQLLREPAGNLSDASPSGSAKHITCMFHALAVRRARSLYRDPASTRGLSRTFGMR